VAAYPAARLADGQFAGPGGAPAQEVPPSLTGVVADGRMVVAVGSQAALPFARPLVLTSPDGGRTWQSTVLRAPAGGGMPLMVAGGHGRWLALGPDAAWTSPDGLSWRLGPGVAPLAGGDRVQALARTRGGFAAVGENERPVVTISCGPRCSGCPPTASPGSAGAQASLTFRPEGGGWPACAGWPRAGAF